MTKRRTTIFDSLGKSPSTATENKYCSKTDLTNESSVESFFVLRLLADLGYSDAEIKTKSSISELAVPAGRKKVNYKPDFVITSGDKPRWLIDAKGTDENIDKWIDQASGYSLLLNRPFTGEKPLQYYALTNGLSFKLYKWDGENPHLTLGFADFTEDNPLFISLKSLLSAQTVRKGWKLKPQKETVTLYKPPMEELKRTFDQCHRIIWNEGNLGPQSSFFEFVKIMFVKLWEDKKLHETAPYGALIKTNQPIPKNQVVFSTWWIDSIPTSNNPIDTILFSKLIETLNENVRRGIKKPIFDEDEHIKLNPATIKQVVEKLEIYDLFGIDDDLNGRLFETFLAATMRGKGLGQFFTPRSIVKLMTKIGDPQANRGGIEKSIDGCCGTGGFLIEILTEMRKQIRDNESLTDDEKAGMLREVANESIFGIDSGMDPPLARIARINMYLHGDGGSRIYITDSLDKSVTMQLEKGTEGKLELEELQKLFSELKFDLVLTNPPFSRGYTEKSPDGKKILAPYRLLEQSLKGKITHRNSLRSSLMFLERYHDLLKPNGRLVTIIDDSILSGENNAFARDFIRENFVIRAVISLHGDAFQRVGARVKTSIIYLIKRSEGDTGQPAVFMYETRYVGLDDVPPKTPASKAEKARENADKEQVEVLDAFKKYLAGEKGEWFVPASKIQGRMDVKYCLPKTYEVSTEWINKGLTIKKLGDIVDLIEGPYINPSDDPEKRYPFLRITYEGMPEAGEVLLGKEISYNELMQANENDIVISNIAASLGATAVITPEFKHLFLTKEFTVLRVKDKEFSTRFLWGLLRSQEYRANMLSSAAGISRNRVKWELLKDLKVPQVDKKRQDIIAEAYDRSITALNLYETTRKDTTDSLNRLLNLDNDWATQRLIRAKPPK